MLAQSDERGGELQLQTENSLARMMGEWSGELTWLQTSGKPESLYRDNAVGIQPDVGGPVVLFGLSHMGLAHGYTLHVNRPVGEMWKLVEVARLLVEADALASIGADLFAARSAGGVVIFSAKRGILGLAACGT
jgi:hypothetical protein